MMTGAKISADAGAAARVCSCDSSACGDGEQPATALPATSTRAARAMRVHAPRADNCGFIAIATRCEGGTGTNGGRGALRHAWLPRDGGPGPRTRAAEATACRGVPQASGLPACSRNAALLATLVATNDMNPRRRVPGTV